MQICFFFGRSSTSVFLFSRRRTRCTSCQQCCEHLQLSSECQALKEIGRSQRGRLCFRMKRLWSARWYAMYEEHFLRSWLREVVEGEKRLKKKIKKRWEWAKRGARRMARVENEEICFEQLSRQVFGQHGSGPKVESAGTSLLSLVWMEIVVLLNSGCEVVEPQTLSLSRKREAQEYMNCDRTFESPELPQR